MHLNSKEKLVHLKASNMMISKPYSTKQLGELGGGCSLLINHTDDLEGGRPIFLMLSSVKGFFSFLPFSRCGSSF